MRAHPALLATLLVLAAAPIGVAEGGFTRAFEHRFDGAGWVSLIVAFDDTGLAELKQRYETGPIGDLQRTREAASMVAVQLEQLRADGTWFWWAGSYHAGSARESNRFDLNITNGIADENTRVTVPGGLTPHQGGARGGLGLLAGAGQVHRFTSWGAGESHGEFWTTLDLPPTARLIAVEKGNTSTYFNAASQPTLGMRAQVNQFGGSLRLGAATAQPIIHSAYVASILPFVPEGATLVDYAGPAAGWNGLSRDPRDIVAGPPGTYEITVTADIELSTRDAVAGTLGGESRDTPAMWLFADVTPAEIP